MINSNHGLVLRRFWDMGVERSKNIEIKYGRNGRPRTCKVIDNGTVKKGICDFLLFHSNNVLINLHRFGDMAIEKSKVAFFDPPHVCLAPPYRMIPLDDLNQIWCPQIIVHGLLQWSQNDPSYAPASAVYEIRRSDGRKIEKWGRNGHSRSRNVIDFGTSLQGICDFLLVININYGPSLRPFRDTAVERLKIAFLADPTSVWCHRVGWTPTTISTKFGVLNLESLGYLAVKTERS